MSSTPSEIPDPVPGNEPGRRARAIEMILLFTVVPGLLAVGPRRVVTLSILAGGILSVIALARDAGFPRGMFFGADGLARGLRGLLRRTAVVWAGLLALTLIVRPQTLFQFPHRRPVVWAIVMVLYPLSAWAQEVIFRTFFFHRYGVLFATARGRVLASGLTFGWAHIVVNNVPAMLLAAIGGVLLAATYERSRSTLLVSVEHALYGDFIFSVGLGSLFYSTARWVSWAAC
ncbi:MAG: CPBP family intramembrane glutamic endopeptidase [Verrucomicrobiota bacterium]